MEHLHKMVELLLPEAELCWGERDGPEFRSHLALGYRLADGRSLEIKATLKPTEPQ